MKRADALRTCRLGLCLALLGALAVVVPSSAVAENGDSVTLGDSRGCNGFGSGFNCASNLTVIDTTGQGFVFRDGPVGSGWLAPSGTLIGYSTSAGPAIHGVNTQSGNAVWGESTSTGIGVNGYSAGGIGAQGQSDATNGSGLKGYAVNGGTAKGVWGVGGGGYGGYFDASASGGYGVYAVGGELGVRALGGPTGVSANGTLQGVKGTTATGSGVFGQNTGSTGIGVEGRTGGSGSAVYGHATASGVGVYGESQKGTGTYGVGGPTGVYGSGNATGVEGSAGGGGTGVYGHNSGSTGIGVWGQTAGVGSAVFGEATANGVGINGKSDTGVAVRAVSTGGTALQVTGKETFSRSGVVTVASGTASKTVNLGGVTTSSMVVATAQQNGSVFVKAAVPASGSFTIFLTGNASGSGLKVAYFVLN